VRFQIFGALTQNDVRCVARYICPIAVPVALAQRLSFVFTTDHIFERFTAIPDDRAAYNLSALGPRRSLMDLRRLHACLTHIKAWRHVSRTEVADIFRAVARGERAALLPEELRGGLLDEGQYAVQADRSLIGAAQLREVLRRVALLVAGRTAEVGEPDLPGDEYWEARSGARRARFSAEMSGFVAAMDAAASERATFLALITRSRRLDARSAPPAGPLPPSVPHVGGAAAEMVQRHAGYGAPARAVPPGGARSGEPEVPEGFRGGTVALDSEANRRALAVDAQVLKAFREVLDPPRPVPCRRVGGADEAARRQPPSREEIAARLVLPQPTFCPTLEWFPGALSDSVRRRVMPGVRYPPVTSSIGLSRARLDARIAEYQIKVPETSPPRKATLPRATARRGATQH